MKLQSSRQPRVPGIYQIYSSKKKRDDHSKKLSQIRLSKRRYIVPNVQVHNSLNNTIRQSRNITFMNRFFDQKDQIAKGNIKIYDKLNQVSGMKSPKPVMRQDIIGNKTFHQNVRDELFRQQKQQNEAMFKRIRSSSATVDNKRFAKDFDQHRKVKQRLERYTADNKLKSQKYYSVALKIREQTLSTLNRSAQLKPNRRQSTATVKFYNRDEIIKNKVENRKRISLSFTARSDHKRRSIQTNEVLAKNYRENPYIRKQRRYVPQNKNSLFPTQTIS